MWLNYYLTMSGIAFVKNGYHHTIFTAALGAYTTEDLRSWIPYISSIDPQELYALLYRVKNDEKAVDLVIEQLLPMCSALKFRTVKSNSRLLSPYVYRTLMLYNVFPLQWIEEYMIATGDMTMISSLIDYGCNPFKLDERIIAHIPSESWRRAATNTNLEWLQISSAKNQLPFFMWLKRGRHIIPEQKAEWRRYILALIAGISGSDRFWQICNKTENDVAPAIWRIYRFWRIAQRLNFDSQQRLVACLFGGKSGKIVYYDLQTLAALLRWP